MTGCGSVPTIVPFAGNGDALAIWEQDEGAQFSIWTNRYVANQGWGLPSKIDGAHTGNSVTPQIAFDGNGNPTVSMGISAQSGSAYIFVQTMLPSYSYRQYQLTGITPGTWNKLALDSSATSVTIYVNNQDVTSISQTNIPATTTVSIGMFWGDSSYTGNLYIDNVQISTSPIWSQTYGGTDDEVAYSVVQTSDGG